MIEFILLGMLTLVSLSAGIVIGRVLRPVKTIIEEIEIPAEPVVMERIYVLPEETFAEWFGEDNPTFH